MGEKWSLEGGWECPCRWWVGVEGAVFRYKHSGKASFQWHLHRLKTHQGCVDGWGRNVLEEGMASAKAPRYVLGRWGAQGGAQGGCGEIKATRAGDRASPEAQSWGEPGDRQGVFLLIR